MKASKILYIGQFQPGTTSLVRGRALQNILHRSEFSAIDILEPFNSAPRILRSIGFRWKTGPLINRINNHLITRLTDNHYYLIWVDKGVFLTESTTKILRERAKYLIHFTPDPAFKYHYSKHFDRSLKYYDKLVTTKGFELEDYSCRVNPDKIMLVSQGFDPQVHYPRKPFKCRIPGVSFIGHHEPERAHILESILQNGIPVFISGRGWRRFAKKHSGNPDCVYYGKGVYGEEYAIKLSDYQFGLGCLSKWIPEKHTTRTVEIPACGSVLMTEQNSETEAFFDKTEALFFKNIPELIRKLKDILSDPVKAETLAENGLNRVTSGDFDYNQIILNVLDSTGIKNL